MSSHFPWITVLCLLRVVHFFAPVRAGPSILGDRLPKNASAYGLTPSPGLELKHLLLGIGTQNYTCSDSLKWTSAGAVADLRDAAKRPELWKTLTLSVPKKFQRDAPHISVFEDLPLIGKHYFVESNASQAGPRIVPKFDLGRKGFVLAKKIAAMEAPHRPDKNVPLLKLQVTEGSLAREIFRLNTLGGAAPLTACAECDHLEVRYLAWYVFFG